MPNSDDISQDDIDVYIAQVEKSAVLGRSKRRIRLLAHLIRSEFLGQGDRLKAYSIGLDIFGKSSEFDPISDSVVRVEMGRLRTALALFEASEFADTRIVIDIPVGTYRPVMALRDPAALSTPDTPAAPTPLERRAVKPVWWLALACVAIIAAGFGLRAVMFSPEPSPTISVQISLTDPSDPTALDLRLTLAQALSRSKAFSLFEATPHGQRGSEINFDVKVSVSELDDTHRATVELLNLSDKRLVWSKTLYEKSHTDLITAAKTNLARELRIRLFGASKTILEALDPKDLSPEALFVLATWVPGVAQSAIAWEEDRIEFARQALTADPEFGAAHSVLADKMAYLANVYGPADTAENRDAAQLHAYRAMDLSPLDPDVVFNVAQSHWHSGRVAESQVTMARVLELDPGHDLARFLHDVIPYTCAVAPDDVLARAIEFDTALSADNPIRWLTVTWIGWLHAYRGEWADALIAAETAARIFQIPYTFMRHAMILNKLDRPEDAATLVLRQGQNWNGFDPYHYTETTIQRLCSETAEPEVFVGYYSDLAKTLRAAATN